MQSVEGYMYHIRTEIPYDTVTLVPTVSRLPLPPTPPVGRVLHVGVADPKDSANLIVELLLVHHPLSDRSLICEIW